MAPSLSVCAALVSSPWPVMTMMGRRRPRSWRTSRTTSSAFMPGSLKSSSSTSGPGRDRRRQPRQRLLRGEHGLHLHVRRVAREMALQQVDVAGAGLGVQHADGRGALRRGLAEGLDDARQRGRQALDVGARLDHVVVGAAAQRGDHQRLVARAGEHHDGDGQPARAHLAQQLQAVAVGQAHVHQQHVGQRARGLLGGQARARVRERVRGGERDVGREPGQAPAGQVGVLFVVFDVQDFHDVGRPQIACWFSTHQYRSICAATSMNFSNSTGLTM